MLRIDAGEVMTKGLLIVLILWASFVTANDVICTFERIQQARKIAALQAKLIGVDEIRQKAESVMLYIGEMEAREWRKEQKRKQGK